MGRRVGSQHRVNNARAMDAVFRMRKRALAGAGATYRDQTSHQPGGGRDRGQRIEHSSLLKKTAGRGKPFRPRRERTLLRGKQCDRSWPMTLRRGQATEWLMNLRYP